MIADPMVFTGGDSGPQESRANASSFNPHSLQGSYCHLVAGGRPTAAPQQSVIPPRKCSVPGEKPWFITTRNPHGSHLCSLTSGPLCLGHSTPPTAFDQLRVIFRVSPKMSLPWRPSLTSTFVLCHTYVKPPPRQHLSHCPMTAMLTCP